MKHDKNGEQRDTGVCFGKRLRIYGECTINERYRFKYKGIKI